MPLFDKLLIIGLLLIRNVVQGGKSIYEQKSPCLDLCAEYGSCSNVCSTLQQYEEWQGHYDAITCKSIDQELCGDIWDFDIAGCKNQCECQCTAYDCSWSSILGTTSNECSVTKLEVVDDAVKSYNTEIQIAGIIASTAASMAAGPIAGAAMKVVFALWTDGDDDASMMDEIYTEINKVAGELEQCMDIKIADYKIEEVWGDMANLISKYELAAGASGDLQIEYIKDSFFDFHGAINDLFGIVENTAYEYEEMLPVYQMVYPLFASVVTERLLYLLRTNDTQNFENEFDYAREDFDVFRNWINLARVSIDNSYEAAVVNAECTAYSPTTELSVWRETFMKTYIDPLEKQRTSIFGDVVIIKEFQRYYKGGAGFGHFYTTDTSIDPTISGYNDEGIEGYCLSEQINDTFPLYRYKTEIDNYYLYTTDSDFGGTYYDPEMTQSENGVLNVYGFEAVECYVYLSQRDGTVPLYRYVRWNIDNVNNVNNGYTIAQYFYTTDWSELRDGTGNDPGQWLYMGEAYDIYIM